MSSGGAGEGIVAGSSENLKDLPFSREFLICFCGRLKRQWLLRWLRRLVTSFRKGVLGNWNPKE